MDEEQRVRKDRTVELGIDPVISVAVKVRDIEAASRARAVVATVSTYTNNNDTTSRDAAPSLRVDPYRPTRRSIG
jgi:hypothetical protein